MVFTFKRIWEVVMSVYFETNLKEIPKNCNECCFPHCNLPYKRNTYKDEIKKEYKEKRHKDCPLRDI